MKYFYKWANNDWLDYDTWTVVGCVVTVVVWVVVTVAGVVCVVVFVVVGGTVEVVITAGVVVGWISWNECNFLWFIYKS